MKIKKYHLFVHPVLAVFIFALASCNQGGEGSKLFNAFNKDENDYLDETEFNNAIEEMNYFKRWNKDNNQLLSEDEWRSGVYEYIGGYQVSTVEKFGEWDLSGDGTISIEEFLEGLFEVVDKDGNNQISESEFTTFYKEGDQKKSR